MRDRIVIKSPVDIPVDGAGAQTVYTLLSERWTKVKTVSNNRVFQDSQTNINDSISFSIRWTSEYTPDKTMLIEYEGNDYTLNSIKQYEDNKRKRFWLITAVSNEQPVQIIVS